ncbi:hypothetical protein DM02DRAFT_138206 [Periconia macrospinosa]|uniref:Uncharacterized protein n=1 Tax=Periconia macrospinosa TaxID=97972 RepID=A0A2V1DCG3_9PLEO|nr:hypothetical protein DM02DRAFT_138206 [Periconia macrospinosa]
MTNNTQQDPATSPTRRSTRFASRSASLGSRASASRDGPNRTQTPRRSSTPKALQNFDWGSFDPNLPLDPGFWENADLGFDFSNVGVQGGDLNTQTSTPFNLLNNTLSAVPGAHGVNFGLGNPQDFQPTWDQAPLQFVPAQPVAAISPRGRRRSSRSASRASVGDVYGTLDASAGVVPGTYQYPEPVDPRDLGHGPYAFHSLNPADESLFIPETRASPYSPVRSRRSLSDAAEDDDRGRKSPSHHSYHSHNSKRSSHRSRSTRSSESETRPPKRKSVFNDNFKFEKPVADTRKPWIRTNGTTKGLTTRTAKCNSYDPDQYYTYSRPPLGDWSSRRNEFHYTKHGELTDATYTAEQIRDFILNYPEDRHNKIKLQLFIQVGPTDSARRYMSQSWAKCRFRECPVNVYEKGTILHGHYRVAFDERSYGTNNRYDPHLAASAYAHLYCMERFLDFEYICRKAHVYVDTRQYSTEPKGKFHATLAGRPECGIAQDFVKYAARGTLRESMKEFAEYPVHSDYAEGEAKPHEHTLTAQMHKVKAATRPAAQIRQFEERGLGPSHILVNKGDLEVLMQEKKRRKEKAAKDLAKRKRERDLENDSDEDEGGGNQAYMNKRRRLVDEAKSQYVVSKRQAPGRRNMRKEHVPEATQQATQQATQPQPWEVDDDEDSLDENHPIPPRPQSARRSRRTAGQHINYTEPPNVVPEIPAGYAPAQDSFRRTPMPTSPSSTRRKSIYVDPELEGVDFDALFKEQGLNRRTSSITNFPPLRTGSILRNPGPRSPPPRSATLRSASLKKSNVSFAEQPVSSSHTFDTQAPPRDRSPRDRSPRSPKRPARSQLGPAKKKARSV